MPSFDLDEARIVEIQKVSSQRLLQTPVLR